MFGGTDYPVELGLPKLTKAAKTNFQLEKAALAVLRTRFRDYLCGNHFALMTNHKPLTGLFSPDKTVPIMAAARIQRWALLLGGYRNSLTNHKASKNVNAGAPVPLEQTHREQEAPEYVSHINTEC